MNILVYAPDPNFAGGMARYFESAGHALEGVASLSEALGAIRSTPPEVVLVHSDVSTQDGVLLAATAKASAQPFRILVILPDGDTSRAGQLQNVGITEVLHGGATRLEILEAIEKPPAQGPELTGFGKVSNTELTTLETLFKDKPDNLEGRWLLGFAYYRSGEFDSALATLEDVVRRAPENLQALYYLGSCYYRLKRNNEASKAWRTVVDKAPGTMQAKKAQKHLDKLGRGSVPPMTRPPSSG